MALLPVHRVPSGRTGRHGREKVILLAIFVLFTFVCFGAFFFVPDFRDKLTVTSAVENLFKLL